MIHSANMKTINCVKTIYFAIYILIAILKYIGDVSPET